MSIKMLIVDDEPIITQGLRQTIPWDSYDVEVVGEAYDGEQALEILRKQCVDIVLTDVKMPEMDGIQLAKIIHQQLPSIRVLIISGYDEFEYARKALQYGVKDYLLKPVEIDELLDKVMQIKKDILKERTLHQRLKMEKMKEAISQRILYPQVQHNIDSVLDEGNQYCVMASELDGYGHLANIYAENELDNVRHKWETGIERTLAGYCESIHFFTHPNLLVTILFNKDELSVQEIGSRLKDVGEKWVGHMLFFGMSSIFQDLELITDSFENAKEALLYKDVIDETTIPYASINRETIPRPKPNVEESILIKGLLKMDSLTLAEFVNRLFETFKQENYNLTEIANICEGLNQLIERKLDDVFDESTIQNADYSIHGTLDLHFYNTNDLLKQLMVKDIEMWQEVISKEKRGKKNWIVEKAKEYIIENFQRDLKASEVANEMHITPNYFSMVFKKETGKSFNEYLNELRIEKAKLQLIETSDRVYEIGIGAGYKDYKYFVQIFRKKTGMTPTEYRDYAGSRELRDNRKDEQNEY